MSETKHTLSQIWNDGVMIKANGALIGQATSEEYARRIVACVNACAGVDITWIESMAKVGGFSAMNHYIAAYNQAAEAINVKKQRDELLAALEEATDVVIGHYGTEGRLAKKCLAAIARAKGEIK